MKFLVAVMVMAILVSSCRSTYIVGSWKAANLSSEKFKKLVVIALVGEDEKKARELMEKHMVDDLKNLGYNAVCSCEEYSPDFFKGLNEKEAIAKLREENVDGILTIVLLDKKKETIFVPGKNEDNPVFWDYYHSVHDRIYTKGYYTVNTKYYWESNLYDLSANQLSYSVQSQSFDPVSTETLAHEYGRSIVKKMVKSDVLVKQVYHPLKPM